MLTHVKYLVKMYLQNSIHSEFLYHYNKSRKTQVETNIKNVLVRTTIKPGFCLKRWKSNDCTINIYLSYMTITERNPLSYNGEMANKEPNHISTTKFLIFWNQ